MQLPDLIVTEDDALTAPVGTVALNRARTDVWQKTGSGNIPWQSLTGGGYTHADSFVRHEGPLMVLVSLSAPAPDKVSSP